MCFFDSCLCRVASKVRNGIPSAAFDIVFEAGHNCLEAMGLKLWLDALASTRRRSLNWMGTQCSSFTVLCRAVSGRSPENDYMGFEQKDFVFNGNLQQEIASLLMWLSFQIGNITCLEQPLNSCMVLSKSMRGTLKHIGAQKFVTYMGCFGGDTEKPLQLWSPSPYFSMMEREKPGGGSVELVTRNGHQFTGKKSELAESQIYTPAFARAVYRVFTHARQQ